MTAPRDMVIVKNVRAAAAEGFIHGVAASMAIGSKTPETPGAIAFPGGSIGVFAVCRVFPRIRPSMQGI